MKLQSVLEDAQKASGAMKKVAFLFASWGKNEYEIAGNMVSFGKKVIPWVACRWLAGCRRALDKESLVESEKLINERSLIKQEAQAGWRCEGDRGEGDVDAPLSRR
jgi:hypothetical protein